jgi:cobalt/nickel transport system permease protein
MAHIHLEDGAFTPFWVIVWSLLALGIVWAALFLIRRKNISPRSIAIAAMCASVGFAVFQVEIPTPIGPVHMNFTPLIGILIGPGLGSLVVLVINIFSAAIGHGGWGMIGANSLVNMLEITLAYYSFRLLKIKLKRGHFWSGFGSTTIALTASAFFVVLIVAVSEIQGSQLSKEEMLGNLLVLAALNAAAGAIEGVVTGYVVSFLGRVRPDLLERSVPRPSEVIPATTAGAT